ncbi:MAG: hypothetical protein IIC67_11285 [Thaumarchaeota archaeon]|nr:hypothetical protein [Nitrososphaerota archaeon]
MSKNKKELTHEVKLSLMRDCKIYGKSFKEEQVYFKSKGYSLSQAQSTRLKQELHSPERIRNWFSKEALYVIEDDHQLSVERIRARENRLMQEWEALASTNFYKHIDPEKPELGFIRDKNHDFNALIRLSGELRAIEEIKSKMFSATPLVQELMTVHRRQEEEEEELSILRRQQELFQQQQNKEK